MRSNNKGWNGLNQLAQARDHGANVTARCALRPGIVLHDRPLRGILAHATAGVGPRHGLEQQWNELRVKHLQQQMNEIGPLAKAISKAVCTVVADQEADRRV